MTVPAIALFELSFRVKVETLIVEESIASEKVAVIFSEISTPVAPSAGLTDITVGGVVSSLTVSV